MARTMCGVFLWGICGVVAAGAAAPASLAEKGRVGTTTRVLVVLKAEGQFRPGTPPGAAKAEPAKPLALKVETRLDFGDRVLRVDENGRADRALRRVVKAASAINGEVRPTSAVLRREVANLVAERRPEGVIVFCPTAPLTRPELELVQGPGDPLTFAGLLPTRPVEVGARWRVNDEATRALTAYDTIDSNALEAVLESIDERTAKVRLTGPVRGSVLGGEGTMTCEGSFTFDRREERVTELTLKRNESRKPGPVEAGLEVKSTLTVSRATIPVPLELADAVVSGLPAEPDARREELVLTAPGGCTLRHDRDWHTYWDDPRQTVLKRLDHGAVIAQANLTMGPNAGAGRHQDLDQFRADLRRALGKRYESVVGEGEVEGDPAGGFRYKVSVQGHEGELGVIWYYFLIAGAQGHQLLATFTLAVDRVKAFGDQDLRMMGSLRWQAAKAE